eukprot:Nitzschia sp. Nitz4//scaffold5_size260463//216593//219051//NITZ4_001016-RA/size260463-augustus-gene-0.84-mRNA-1//1//CDS//3329555442//4482//frame0
MTSWSHFLGPGDSVISAATESNCFQSDPATAQDRDVDPSIESVILRTLSSSPIQDMARNSSGSSGACLGASALETDFRAAETNTIPRRNLTDQFDEVYSEPVSESNNNTPLIKQANTKEKGSTVISPTGVADLEPKTPEKEPKESHVDTTEWTLPRFCLHPELQRELSDALVDRVSFYSVIHDVNKEATSMAANDDSGFNRTGDTPREEYDQLVVAVNGYPSEPYVPSTRPAFINFALIDEERWLLDAIEARGEDETRTVKACPPTFLQAMGERDYENPLTSLSSGSRTQLWKPSRSWWEAKSGKNPWIEPKSHNKRWRYLWPLIHYHKFLARCIKKLKRNGVDVKSSVSPVAVFLREEVCAVSDHLAAVSLFDSNDWMAKLELFSGWLDTDPKVEERIRRMVGKLQLRQLDEPGDVDSPLLRSQIDENYLRAMAAARAQMEEHGTEQERRIAKDPSTSTNRRQAQSAKRMVVPPVGPPPSYPRPDISYGGIPHNMVSPAGMRRPHWGYPPHPPHPVQWWAGGWHPHQAAYPYGDDASVQSGLSGDSFPQPYEMAFYPAVMQQYQYVPQMPYAPQQNPNQIPQEYNPSERGTAPSATDSPVHSTKNDPPAVATPSVSEAEGTPKDQPSQRGGETPYKYNASSPYWGHLDHTTLAMMGIATPQGFSGPKTPSRHTPHSPDVHGDMSEAVGAVHAQPLLLRQQQYATYGYYNNRENYVPPSPATQFMMSPQQASFAYGYNGYDNFAGTYSSPQKAEFPQYSQYPEGPGVGTDPTAMTPPHKTKRGSPLTAKTVVESASL